MAAKYKLDSLDKKILDELQKDARRPFLDVARKLGVSGGTIHQRVEKLKESGVIVGSKTLIDYKVLGYGVSVFLGVYVKLAKDITQLISKLDLMEEVVEVHYTTGNFALLVKVYVRDIDHFHNFLIKKLQVIDEITSTESFICLDTPIQRSLTHFSG